MKLETYKIFIRLLIVTLTMNCSGCFYLYNTVRNDPAGEIGTAWDEDDCEIRFSIEFNQIERDYSVVYGTLYQPVKEFKSSPETSEYEDWTRETIESMGCRAVLSPSQAMADLTITINDDTIYGSGHGQAQGILLVLTLYLIPIHLEYLHRSYLFRAGDDLRYVQINSETWSGWLLLPVSPFSLYPHEKKIYQAQLLEYLFGKESVDK